MSKHFPPFELPVGVGRGATKGLQTSTHPLVCRMLEFMSSGVCSLREQKYVKTLVLTVVRFNF